MLRLNNEELIGSIEHLTLQTGCRVIRCRYKRGLFYLYVLYVSDVINFHQIQQSFGGRNRVVGCSGSLRAERSGDHILMDAEDFFFSIPVQTNPRVRTTTCRMNIGSLCQRQSGRSLDHPTPHSVEFKHRYISHPRFEWQVTRRPLPPPLTLNLVKHNGNYILHAVT